MTKADIYTKLKTINAIAWRDDDLMEQDNLFDLQEQLANLLLAVAQDCGEKTLKDLVKSFPYLYSIH